MSLNIVVVGPPNPELDEVLNGLGSGAVVVRSPNLNTIAAPTASQPDVVVVDQRGRAELDPALTALRREHPATGVVVVASRLDPPLMLEAMRAGVSEWVTDPVTATDLGAAISRVTSNQDTKSTGKVLAFVGAKGGVGTTTLAVNVSTVIAKHGSPTILIDLHPAFGDAAVFLGKEPRFSVKDALENSHRLDQAFLGGIVTHTPAGPDLLASPSQPTAGAASAEQIKTLVAAAASHYPYVVLDCPRWDSSTIDGLESVSDIVMVVDQELATLRNASRMVSALRQRYGKRRIKSVVARYDSNADIGQDDIARVMGDEVDHVIPSDYRQSVEALNAGEPLVLGKSPTKLTASIKSFVHTLTGLNGVEAKPTSSKGIFGRLTGRK